MTSKIITRYRTLFLGLSSYYRQPLLSRRRIHQSYFRALIGTETDPRIVQVLSHHATVEEKKYEAPC